MKSLRWLVVLGIVGLLSASFALAADKANESENATEVSSAAAYPLDHCIVSGEKLGEMGDPVVKVYNGREVKFCCNMCVKSFEKDQAKWMKKLDDAIIAQQKDSYPMQTCVVSGEKLGDMAAPVDFVYQNRLVRFCCNNCVKTFEKNPEKYLSMLDAARSSEMPKSEMPKDEKSMEMDSHHHEGMGH